MMISFGICQYYYTAVPTRNAICDDDLDAVQIRSHAAHRRAAGSPAGSLRMRSSSSGRKTYLHFAREYISLLTLYRDGDARKHMHR